MHPYIELGSKSSVMNKFSIRSRTKKNPILIVNSNPGPGSYEPTAPKAKTLSIYRQESSRYTKGSSSLERIPIKNVPGPGDYNMDNTFMSSQSTFIDTKKRTMSGNKFST